MINPYGIASYRVLLATALVLGCVALAPVANAQTVSATVTITKPADNTSLKIPSPPSSTGAQTIQFASTNLFQVTGMSANYSFGISTYDCQIKCNGTEVSSFAGGPLVVQGDASGEFKGY